MKPAVLVLTGPTGAGKSAWAMRLAQSLPIEIVSCDSAQVYRGLDIGSAKPDAEARRLVPHHLLDIRDPVQAYSAGDFAADARDAIADILARGRVPLVVGGTMLYLRALIGGIAQLPRADPGLRSQIDERAAALGWPALHAELQQVDPAAAARIHPNDSQRIQRAIEVFRLSGRPISEWQREQRAERGGAAHRYVSWAVLPTTRAALHARIEARLTQMLEGGFLDEVRRLHARGDLTPEHASIRAVGYRQFWEHLDGLTSHDEAVRRALAATRQLAKRQITWLNSDASLARLDAESEAAFDVWRRHVLDAIE